MKAKWTEESVKSAIQTFINKNGREPEHNDFLEHESLPHPRVLQRRFGGMKNVRTSLGITPSFREGKIRADKAITALKASRRMEAELFNELYKKYDTDFETGNIVQVTRQFQYQQYIPDGKYYANTSVDMAVSFRNKKHVMMIDVFHPSNKNSLQGCVNIKKAKVEKYPVCLTSGYTHKLLFVCTNKDITQEDIEKYVKKHDLYTVMSYDTFKHDILDTSQNHCT